MGLFGIFDGHGGNIFFYLGPECAEYASKYFAEVLKNK
jgi:serine/threonine protein phosphatase PrpC